ncbi:MAG: hypothetical protein KDA91_11225 [Planctomycetaceae bacterium]|nr:hypothetical protein [Planctomycetaceae bacterium]
MSRLSASGLLVSHLPMFRWLCCLLVFAFAAMSNEVISASTHPFSITETDIFVTKSRAIMRLQMFAEDLVLFHELEANESDVVPASEIKRGLELHRDFLLERVTLRDARGELLKGHITDLQSFEIPEAGIATTDMMLHTAVYQIEFPFADPPEFLTIQQDLSDPDFVTPSEMKLSVHQTGSDLTFTDSMKAGAAVTLRFDWTETPLSEDASDEEWESWFAKQREQTLGIMSYSSVYSFIYIDPTELRHEVLIPLATLKTFLPIQHRDPSFIDIDEQDAVRELIRNWLKDVNPTTINGLHVNPEFTRIDLLGLDQKDMAANAEKRRTSLANGRVGIILTYHPSDRFVRAATVEWTRFHSTMRKVESVVIAGDKTLQRFEFSRFNKPADNTFAWECPPEFLPETFTPIPAETPPLPTITVPMLSFGLLLGAIVSSSVCYLLRSTGSLIGFGRISFVGLSAILLIVSACTREFGITVFRNPFKSPPLLATSDCQQLAEKLHARTYKALEAGAEAQILDSLATAVDGPLLEELYLQMRRSLELRDQGGAVARVTSVTYDSVDITQPTDITRSDGENSDQLSWPGFEAAITWTVAGTVEHWGHIHERQNQFEAVFAVEPANGAWKFSAMDLRSQKQKSQRTNVRRF